MQILLKYFYYASKKKYSKIMVNFFCVVSRIKCMLKLNI
jgi:hypothetical protein